MTSVEAPPPSYDSVVSKAEQRIGNNVTPEKVLSVASNLSSTEAKVMTEKEIDPRTLMTQVDKDAFDKGVHDYLKTEAAKERLKVNADEATKACQLINTMFSNLSVKLGEIDSKNLGKLQFKDTFSKLHDNYIGTLQTSAKLAVSMADYARRFETRILKIVFDKRIPYPTKIAKLDEYIADAQNFEDEASKIQKSFTSLQTEFGSFTGSFNSWATGEENKNDPEMEQLRKDIATLQSEISDIKSKMAIWGSVGAIGTIGVTAALVCCLGPFGLIAGLIGAGVTIGFMVHWSNEITNRDNTIREKKKRLDKLVSDKDAIIATRLQLVELGKNSFNIYKDQLNTLNNVWTYALLDAHRLKGKLEQFKRDGKEADLDDAVMREVVILPSAGEATGLYSLMATYLERYANGVNKAS